MPGRFRSVGRIGCEPPTEAAGHWPMPPSTRWARIAASLRPARPGRAAAWRPPSFRPSERNRPAPKTTRSTIWTWSDIWPSGTSTRRRWDMSADPMSSRRSLRRPPRESPRRSTPFRVERAACWRSCTPSTARSPLCHRGPRPSRGVGSRRWCSGTSKHPAPRRKRLAGSTPHIKRCERIRLAAM